MKLQNKIIICLIFAFGLTVCGYQSNAETLNKNICNQSRYEINGEDNIKLNQLVEYTIKDTNNGSAKIKSVNYKLFKNNKLVEFLAGEKYSYNFKTIGTNKLTASFIDNKNCKYNLEKTINVYKKSILYIGENINEFDLGFKENFDKHSILFEKIILDKNLLSENDLLSELSQNLDYLKDVDSIIINYKNFESIFQTIDKINKANNSFYDKQIFIISDINNNFLKRILAKYIKLPMNYKIYTLNTDYFLNFLSNISFDKEIITQSYIKTFSTSFKQMPKYFVVSYFVDHLIYAGMPITLIGILLILGISVLVISIFRQVIGFSVFGIYSPLMFAISMFIIGIQLSLILFVITFLSTLVIRFLNKKIYLLYSAKISLLIIFYLLMIILIFGIDKLIGTNIIDIQIFSNDLIIFPIIFMILITEKIFNEGFKLFSSGWIISLVEFAILSFIIYSLLNWTALKHLLLSYPDLIIIVFVLNIIVGRFTGLQLLEYFRFMPLIKKHLEGEEE